MMAGDPSERGVLGALLARLDGVRRIGDGRWSAKSPLRPRQRTGSLSLRELPDGRVLLHDFAGGSPDEIVRAVGLTLADLFPPRAGEIHHAPRERRPYSVAEAVRALRSELHVVWVVLADIGAGAPIDDATRRRASLARRRCEAMIAELGRD